MAELGRWQEERSAECNPLAEESTLETLRQQWAVEKEERLDAVEARPTIPRALTKCTSTKCTFLRAPRFNVLEKGHKGAIQTKKILDSCDERFISLIWDSVGKQILIWVA